MIDLTMSGCFLQAVIRVSGGRLPIWMMLLIAAGLLLGVVIAVNSIRAALSSGEWRRARPRRPGLSKASLARFCALIVSLVVLGLLIRWLLSPAEMAAPTSDPRASDQQWVMFHANPARTGRADSLPPPAEPRLAWKFHNSLILERLPFAGSPAIAGPNVLIGGDAQELYCLSFEDGTPRWVFQAKAPIFCSPAVWNGRVYVGEGLHQNRDCKLYCLDLRDGSVLWSVTMTSHTESSPTVDGGRVYFGAGEDGVYCVDAMTGREVWHLRKGHVDGSPLVVNDRLYVGSGYGLKGLLCVDASSGRLLWTKELPAPCWGGPSYVNGRLFLAVGNGTFNQSDDQPLGMVMCLDAATGNELWRFSEVGDAVLTSVAVQSGRAVFGSRDGSCYAVNESTGQLAWKAEVLSPILSSPAVAENRVFFGADDGLLHCLSLEDGRPLWTFDTNPDVLAFSDAESKVQSSPAVAGGRVVFGASNGNVYCLGTSTRAQPIVARTKFRSRLMLAADAAMAWLLAALAGLTGSFGAAILLMALATRLVLLPLDWLTARHVSGSRGRVPVLAVGYALVQACALVVFFLVLSATPLVAGKPFLWIADLARPDRLAAANLPNWLMNYACPLPALLGLFVWLFLHTRTKRRGVARHALHIVLAVAAWWSACYWPAAPVLFCTAAIGLDILSRKFTGRHKELC